MRKMKRKSYYSILAIIAVLYLIFIAVDIIYESNDVPVIKAPNSTLIASVKDKDEVLLEGVVAEDKEDGDLTDEVFIENISEFNSQKERTITYIVIDKDNGIARTSRMLKYSDYKEPEIYIKKPLVVDNYGAYSSPESYVGARSVVDGNLSDKVSLDALVENEDNTYASYYVTDSCGIRTDIKLNFTRLNNNPNIKIKLTDYMVRVKKGTDINPRKYLKSVNENGIENKNDFSSIRVKDNYNKNKPGIYEFIYDIARSNGNFGLTKLVVVVE